MQRRGSISERNLVRPLHCWEAVCRWVALRIRIVFTVHIDETIVPVSSVRSLILSPALSSLLQRYYGLTVHGT
jgi:hypothetical protein